MFHVVGPEYLDRLSFAQLVCRVFDVDPGFLRPHTTAELGQRAARPLRGGLDAAKARAVLSTALLAPRQGLELTKQRLQAEGMMG